MVDGYWALFSETGSPAACLLSLWGRAANRKKDNGGEAKPDADEYAGINS